MSINLKDLVKEEPPKCYEESYYHLSGLHICKEFSKNVYYVIPNNEFKNLYEPPVIGSIEVYLGSYEDIVPKISITDAIFFDPPWVEDGQTYNRKNALYGRIKPYQC